LKPLKEARCRCGQSIFGAMYASYDLGPSMQSGGPDCASAAIAFQEPQRLAL